MDLLFQKLAPEAHQRAASVADALGQYWGHFVRVGLPSSPPAGRGAQWAVWPPFRSAQSLEGRTSAAGTGERVAGAAVAEAAPLRAGGDAVERFLDVRSDASGADSAPPYGAECGHWESYTRRGAAQRSRFIAFGYLC